MPQCSVYWNKKLKFLNFSIKEFKSTKKCKTHCKINDGLNLVN